MILKCGINIFWLKKRELLIDQNIFRYLFHHNGSSAVNVKKYEELDKKSREYCVV